MASPHFFKIVLEETLRGKKLRIPAKFMKRYGKTLSKDVLLELPCSSTWKLGLKSSVGCSNRVWLVDGWQEFANQYSLKIGHVLVFKYKGNSKFRVVICDYSTCEIDYPSNPIQCDEHDQLNNTDVENQRSKRKEVEEGDFQSPSPSSRPNKRMRTSPSGRHGVPDKGDGEKSTTMRNSKLEVLRGMERLTKNEKSKALNIASGFKSKNSFFKVVMQPSYVLTNCLKVPTKFAREYLNDKACKVKLKVGENNWDVNYSFGDSAKSWPTPRFNNGWRKFCEENNLDIGDVCVFVMAKDSAEISFKVAIFRANENANPSLSPAHADGRIQNNETDSDSSDIGCRDGTYIPGTSDSPRARLKPEGTRKHRPPLTAAQKAALLERSCNFKPKHPFFKVVMQPSYTNSNSYLPVPYEFAKIHIKKNQVRLVPRIPDGRTWFTENKIRQQKKGQPKTAGLYGGWAAFAVDNNLEVGDVCIFELVKGTEILLQVSIVRLDDDAYRKLCQGSEAATSSAKLKKSVKTQRGNRLF
ncbi:B3 domain-containing transcription factor VRN1 [Morus notabilis]|uniref:B3 domain-containing transcription factor VRN1 n=1 Tax=Morus notabilis TaxID=981085 RepID=UPI000CED0B12|nr:B3 domain-containing transcription factor VRN1 [Morus notabilis]